MRRRRGSSIPCRTSELAGHLEAAAWLAGVELYLDRYAEARRTPVAPWPGPRHRPGGALLLLIATLGGLLRQRGKLAESAELLDGGVEAARLLGQHPRAGVEPGRPLGRRAAERGHGARPRHRTGKRRPQRGAEELPLGRGSRGSRRSPARDRRTGTRGRVAARRRGRRGAGAHRREPESPVPRGARALPGSRSVGTPRHDELPLRGGLGLGRAAPDGVAWAGRAAAAVDLYGGDPSRAAEQALASAAVADEAGAPVEAALSRTLAGRALAQSRRA